MKLLSSNIDFQIDGYNYNILFVLRAPLDLKKPNSAPLDYNILL